jgi:hypothetical protein
MPARQSRLAAPATTGGDGAFHVEMRRLGELKGLAEDWAGLAERALERNIFAEPVFALMAAQHVAEAREVMAVLVWQRGRGADAPPRLMGLFPVIWPRLPLLPGIVRGWRPPLSGLGTPLVDHGSAELVIEAFLAFLRSQGPRAAAMLFPTIPTDGAFARALDVVMRRGGHGQRRFDAHRRAVLRATAVDRKVEPATLTAKKSKELRRQLRRLGEHGPVDVLSARDPMAVRNAVELFLTLEASGWKRARGTALLQNAGSAAFVRAMTRLLARAGRCRVDVLVAGNRAVAAGIVIESGDRAWFWKIAYDEAFARHSPGVQLTLGITANQLNEHNVSLTDSCAAADHAMIDRLWSERMTVADILVPTSPAAPIAAFAAGAREAMRRSLRRAAKSAYHSLRNVR